MFVVFENVSLAFGKRTVIDRLSFTVTKGTSHALIGPSGSGKTTILALIADHMRPASGRILGEFRAHRFAWIVQSSPVLAHRTVLDNVALGALATGVTHDEALEHTHDALALVDLAERTRDKAGTLSGGERQRVAVARGISAQAGLILADEPTASLDARSRDAVLSALSAAVEAGCTLIVATHDPHVQGISDQVTTLTPAGD